MYSRTPEQFFQDLIPDTDGSYIGKVSFMSIPDKLNELARYDSAFQLQHKIGTYYDSGLNLGYILLDYRTQSLLKTS